MISPAFVHSRFSRKLLAGMTDDQRKAALDGIDPAIRELEGDLAKAP